jgi:NAD-dependent SIR2 family protein deacetylase
LYKNTRQHNGFDILKSWTENKPYFVFTSNVDGHFNRVFPSDKIVECHGSITHLQCVKPCSNTLWSALEDFDRVKFDETTFLADETTLPRCRVCRSAAARPNVLMFGDGQFVGERTDEQYERYAEFCDDVRDERWRIVVLEIGAGEFVPTVRHTSETVVNQGRSGSLLVRINPHDVDVPPGHISLPLAGLHALQLIDAAIKSNE